ncbi:MAG: hypothetical protein KME23_27645 [Goleter apudmare HA4340-LM2]|jgi:hypothetical protein|nr:hypothetical protein [Goleter apudmare HA4340-LM2]
MSSGSSGRYQSKLFNFVHQQSRRLTTQLEHTFHHVQVATKWGVELLLYPVYLLLQPSQSTTKKLHTKEPQSRLQLESQNLPTADAPIQQVLETVKNLPSEVSTDPPLKTSPSFSPFQFLGSLWQRFSHHHPSINPTSSPTLTIPEAQAKNLHTSQTENSLKFNHLVVQGIATSLANRHLVLVTPDNVILDILTSQQQAQLEDRIITEIAKYWQALRVFKVKQQAALLPEINHLLAKLTGSNPRHVAALSMGKETAELDSKYLLKSDKLLVLLDAVVAKLEASALVPVQQRSQEIIEVVQTQFSIFLYGKEELAARGQISVTNDELESHTLNIQELITAALNYFFGVSADKNLESSNSDQKVTGKRLSHRNSQALPKSRRSQDKDLAAEPWLSWSDLFGNSHKSDEEPVASVEKKQPALVSSSSASDALPKNLTGSYQNILQLPQSESESVQKKKPTRNHTPKQKISRKASNAKGSTPRISQSGSKSKKGEISQQRRQSTQMEPQPDWIEVEAIHMGYEKHILEQILELLDAAMLWVEKILLKIFQWLQQLWRGK